MKVTYTERRTFVRYDEGRIIAYLGEDIVSSYKPEDAPEDMAPVTGYSYEGELPDGGTMLDCSSTDRDSLVNAVIRTRYSQTEEDAIKTHQILLLQDPDIDKAEEYAAEWSEFLAFRMVAIQTVDNWL